MALSNKPFREQLAPPARELLSELDTRDFKIVVRQTTPEKEKFWFTWTKAPILNQLQTDYCTAFAGLAGCGELLAGRARPEFTEVYNDETAFFIAKKQMSSVTQEFFRKLLPVNITRFKGRNMKAALWNMNKGVRTPNGSMIYLDSYYRCDFQTSKRDQEAFALEICRFIEMRGVIFAGMVLRGDTWFQNGRYIGTGRFDGGHAILLCGYDVKKKVIYFKNSWGKKWGTKKNPGYGEIPFDKAGDLRELWAFGQFYFQIPEGEFMARREKAREQKLITV